MIRARYGNTAAEDDVLRRFLLAEYAKAAQTQPPSTSPGPLPRRRRRRRSRPLLPRSRRPRPTRRAGSGGRGRGREAVITSRIAQHQESEADVRFEAERAAPIVRG